VFVFGYGSLLAGADGGVPCRLRGFRRAWNVAMENRRTIPGYKYYLDERDERPEVFVTFLNVLADGGGSVNGVALEVGADALAALDRREFSYERFDVTPSVEGDLGGGAVYAYLGRCAARARFERGRRSGRAVVSRAYVDNVRAGFAAHGMLDEFERTTEPLELPARELRQIPVPWSA
jgi:cation transport regulator ChaC